MQVFGTAIGFGELEIQVGLVEQIPDRACSYAIARCIVHVFEKVPSFFWLRFVLVFSSKQMKISGATMREAMNELEMQLRDGLDVLAPYADGKMKRPRMIDVWAAINRMRGLELK